MGKTLLLRALWRESRRSLVLDLLGHFDYGLLVRDFSQCHEWLRRRPERYRLILRPGVELSDREQLAGAADWVCMTMRAISSREAPVELFLDEIDAYCSSSNLPPNLDLLIRFGRHAGATLRAAVRRPKAVIPRHYVTEATRISIFRTVDPADRDFLSEYTGLESETLAKLRPLHFIEWTDGALCDRRVILDPAGGSPTIGPWADNPAPLPAPEPE